MTTKIQESRPIPTPVPKVESAETTSLPEVEVTEA